MLELIHEKSLKNNYYNEQLFFLTDCKEMLETLNALRNKVWHRGLYILNYEALDELVGKYKRLLDVAKEYFCFVYLPMYSLFSQQSAAVMISD
ncbi:hypothetical protein MEN41_20020 [Dolichospermum sp. ST_con]|nr:hypothetical protein [Dolichospermum sp. ST_con]MDD1420186.1 hypothetical protein [Dolichospermum sp. ST_sed1]MDD1425968.1 hypothetical protein [Dolichospermum sp. ST_sed9]MDD1432436.1 hypothetical protein [Dolichospermum sp. ST_sed6]MDD1436076.1 hypothetical protein [Dolichospermum sp. ST_sed10]MDD1441814.1 hypothetical protein [Dolichospermum sp. ST_sed3]MDD1445360.1 hypothetical protein [Dolichospermum sp. ST_sed8]MDD1454572.1 hypothetical protein [Dolichospermum sp. ST_sed7]MDD146170